MRSGCISTHSAGSTTSRRLKKTRSCTLVKSWDAQACRIRCTALRATFHAIHWWRAQQARPAIPKHSATIQIEPNLPRATSAEGTYGAPMVESCSPDLNEGECANGGQ